MRRNIVAEAVGLPLRLGRALVLGLSSLRFRLSASVQPGARFARGAVVTDDVPPWSVVAGSPATAVRSAREPQS